MNRHRRLQAYDPYPRPPPGPSKFAAPHSDQLDTDADHHGTRNAGSAHYQRFPGDRHLDHSIPALAVHPSSPSDIALPPRAFHSPVVFPDAGEDIRKQLHLPRDVPIDLWSVGEPADGSRPSMPLTILTKLAIYGTETKRLTLQGIFRELIGRFRWYNEHQNETKWKNSIRHALSLHQAFRKLRRPMHESGKGCYWTLDMSGGDGFKRPRKRAAAKNSPGESGDDDIQFSKFLSNSVPPRVIVPRMKKHKQSKKYRTTDVGVEGNIGDQSDTYVSDFQVKLDPALRDARPSIISPPTTVASRNDSVPPAPASPVRAGVRVSSRLRSRSGASLTEAPATVLETAHIEHVSMRKGRCTLT
ncbi:hypothetical protein C8R44DRAFT_900091 [Mycena epipterygia]|nr:hypothetical protein C8R44DRAFT_900091 [Mycena epipterygia]